ncbi:helix-turn-helix domain-containing protein [Streptomyces uncialis]|uniref:helix-turn-helix domain-containing protein n=1 Tax=Streptomyces uncialis TaxID=1048205 RepID=UPI0037A49AED
MVRCPVYEDHLICLIAADPVEAADGEPTDQDSTGLPGVLRHLVGAHRHYALGVSRPHPLDATAAAYDQARHALAQARGAHGRIAGYDGQEPLARLLPPGKAGRWAADLLRPMGSAPQLTLDITRLALTFPRSGVARLMGISRNTVAAHLQHTEEALGLDLRDPRSRAALSLALALTTPQDTEQTTDEPTTPTLDDLLRTRAATAWADSLLAPLRPPARQDLHRTLLAWIEAGTDARQAAHRLGISRNTVRARLRTAEQALGRDILNSGSSVHELVHAFLTTGELTQASCVPQPRPRSAERDR